METTAQTTHPRWETVFPWQNPRYLGSGSRPNGYPRLGHISRGIT